MGDPFAQIGPLRHSALDEIELDEKLIRTIEESIIRTMVQTQLDVTGDFSLKEVFDAQAKS